MFIDQNVRTTSVTVQERRKRIYDETIVNPFGFVLVSMSLSLNMSETPLLLLLFLFLFLYYYYYDKYNKPLLIHEFILLALMFMDQWFSSRSLVRLLMIVTI